MKPTLLTMQAFGPFAEREIVDFTKLGTNPLFLINGPTGSGKTSILDAICFALYGETTGNERQGSQMRSDQASIDLPTEIVLEFALNNKCYRVTRTPEQEAPKARGEGTTVRKHTASLYDITEGELLITSKTAQVRTEITALLGLNETQFRQVMVLPQGKFRELLLATSKDREAIFGQLFQTDVYKKIEFALKDKASAISKSKDEFDNQIRGALQVAEVSTEQELSQRHVALSGELVLAQTLENAEHEKLNVLKSELHQARTLHEQFSKLETSRSALVAHHTKKDHIEGLTAKLKSAHNAAKLELPYANLQSINKQIEDFEQKIALISAQIHDTQANQSQAQAQLEQAQRNADTLPKLSESLFLLEQVKQKLAEKDALQQEVSDLEVKSEELAKKMVQYVGLKDKLTLEAESGLKTLEKARKDINEKANLDNELLKKQQLLTTLKKYKAIMLEHDRLTSQSSQQESLVATEKRALDEISRNANQLELTWHNAQASILAQKLEQDKPCPVCGGLEHPAPAQFVGETVTKEQVQDARHQERRALEQFNQASNALLQHQNAIAHQKTLLNELQLDLAENATLDITLLEQQIAEVANKVELLATIDLAKMEQDVVELNQRCSNGEAKIHELKAEIAANNSALGMKQQQLNKVIAGIEPTYSSIAAVDQHILANQSSINQIKQELENAQSALQQVTLRLTNLQSQSQTNIELRNQAQQQQKSLEQEWKFALQGSGFESEQSFLSSRAEESQIAEWNGEVNDFSNTSVKLQQTIADLEQQLSSFDKPNLEQKQAELDEAEQKYQQVRTALDTARSVCQRIEKVQQDIALLHDKNSKLEAEYKVYGTLYDVASGKTGSRISLHRFVLGVLLDDVLIQASQRLTIMSKGRYQLVRKTEGFKGSAGRGLDLCVEDGYTGKSRDVATLSGGESFMAALALALGLSDVVQSYSGGIRLDTLFIDEGFGSLDPESLDLAIQTLVDLQQAGRMIGLISHVSELKEQIAQRIDVQPSRIGSTIKLVVT